MMRKFIQEKIEELYGKSASDSILERAEFELQMMERYGMEEEMEALCTLVQGFREKNVPFFMGGAAASSFLLYLMGATDVNPLPPHYYHSKTKEVLFQDAAHDGFDLPAREGEPDGHDLQPVIFWGLEEEVSEHNKPTIPLCLPEGAYSRTKSTFLHDYRYDKMEKSELAYGKGFRCGCIFISSNILLPESDETWFRKIPSRKLKDYTLENFVAMLKLEKDMNIKPTTFLGVMRIFGLTRGSWARVNNQRMLPQDGMEEETYYSLNDFGYSLDVVPAFYDDVYEMLLREGIPEEDAYYEARRVSIGRGLSEEISNILYDNPAISWCNSAIRLFPKAYAIETLFREYKFYRMRQEEEFRKWKEEREAE